MQHALVVLLGMGTVFVGLICMVFLCMGMSVLIEKLPQTDGEKETLQNSSAVANAPIADRQAIIAATCAVIAEELGTEVKNIKVVSFKRV